MTQAYCKKILILLFTITCSQVYSQKTTSHLIAENTDIFIKNLTQNKKKQFSINIAKTTSLLLTTTLTKVTNTTTIYIGTINNQRHSSFTIYKSENQINGDLILQEDDIAYKISTDQNGKVYISKVELDSIICVDYEISKEVIEVNNDKASQAIPVLESLPGAPGIIYLDFDGEVVSGTSWLSGATINALSPNFSNQKIIDIWNIMAEDFRSFNLNITTRRDLYEAAPINKRMMCIFTPTKDARPQSGGVAYRWSFSSFSDNPCWVFNLSTRAAGETGSHEIGHTLGLTHDGRPNETYYSGHGQWAPIMGWSANKTIGQWSIGEYDNANNTQDDIAIISGNTNDVGFRDDDHNDIITEATPILVDTDGNVDSSINNGFIHNREDKDVFSFVIETGNVTFNFNPNPYNPNLNIQARILNGIGEEIIRSDPSGLEASVNIELTSGTYFIEIDGIGEGTLSNGYSDYSSIGNYFISGNYTPGNNNQPPIANFEATTNCDTVNFMSTTINNVTSYLWDFGDGNTSNEQNPIHTYASSGNYSISLTTTNNAGQDTRLRNDFISINLPLQPTGEDQNICIGQSITLTVTGNSEFKWYDAPTNGNLLHTGASFDTSTLQSSQTYYVSGTFDTCITTNRTPIQVIVNDNPVTPTINIPDSKNLTISNSYHRYQWYLNGIAIENSNNEQYLPNKIGDYSVEVFNEVGCSSTSEMFAVDLSQVNLSQNTSVFKYYPNPTKNVLSIDGLTSNEKDIKIVNSFGQVIINQNTQQEIDVTNLSEGLYMIVINGKYLGKFIKL